MSTEAALESERSVASFLPADAPAPGSCVRVTRKDEGLAVLVLDPPHRKLAVLDMALMRDLDLALDSIEADKSLRALVITGREPLSFAAGADVAAIGAVTKVEDALELVRFGQRTFDRIALLSRESGGPLFTVAAVGGPVPGGAYELALACDRIVCADDPKTRVGLPEVKLGIFPAWGGTQRLPRRIGVPKALAAILGGRLYPARQAKSLGLVDRLTHPEYLVRIASEIALGRKDAPRRRRGIWRYLIDLDPPVRDFVQRQAEKRVRRETGGHYPGPLAAIPLVVRAPGTPLQSGLEAEARAVAPLLTGPVTKSLVALFELSESAKKLGLLPSGDRPARVGRAGVIGAGVMGRAIASALAEAEIDTRLRDVDRRALDEAVREHRTHVDQQRKRRRLLPHEARAAVDRLEATTLGVGFQRCELVLEAVAERLDVKRSVFGELSAALAPDAILATNTSSLSVTAIAEGIPHPERVVGMHFFNPVRRMPLVEVVRGDATSDEVVARTARLALDLGKTPVVVKDVPGFLVNRLLGPYLDEALRLWEAGADPEAVDRALRDFGMPMGPFELLDEVGLDIADHAADSLEAGYGARMAKSRSLAPLVEAKELGKKTGRGIYLYAKKRGRLARDGRNPRFARPMGGPRHDAALFPRDHVDRCVLAMVNEAARALDEQVVASSGELDLATVFGMGFPPFRGGLWRYATALGLGAVRHRLLELTGSPGVAERPGGPERFAPAGPLAEV